MALLFVSSSVYIIVCFLRSGKKQLCFEGLGVDDRSVRWGWALLLVFILTCPLFYLDGIDVDGADRIGFCYVIWVGPTDWWSLVTNRTSGKKRVDVFWEVKKKLNLWKKYRSWIFLCQRVASTLRFDEPHLLKNVNWILVSLFFFFFFFKCSATRIICTRRSGELHAHVKGKLCIRDYQSRILNSSRIIL